MTASSQRASYVLGAGITGLAAGIRSGFPVLEASPVPGGLCASYYMRPRSRERLFSPPDDGDAYRFELGGGHWIFDGATDILGYLGARATLSQYRRKSSVYFRGQELYVPYPLQNHLRFLPPGLVRRALDEMSAPKKAFTSMRDWLLESFGAALCELFFFPFHELYTSGLYRSVAPQDAFKSPVDMDLVRGGAAGDCPAAGYNTTFRYPVHGLDELIRRMAAECRVQYVRRVERIDLSARELVLTDGARRPYDQIISSLPLNEMVRMSGLAPAGQPDPYTAVLVLNIGARKGRRMPGDHWLYNPDARSGFHRVGFYSNVDASFLPTSARQQADRVSIYVERSHPPGPRPGEEETRDYTGRAVQELQDWEFIRDVEVVDACWIPIAYTWASPGSEWVGRAISELKKHGIVQAGRYGCWKFQGIADSISDGFQAGESVR